MEKANKQTLKLLQSINEQDMPRYGVLYRLRPRLIHHHHSSASSSSPSSSSSSPSTTLVVPSLPIRIAYRLNLGLPCFAIDLTTIDHIDEHSFGQYDPTLDPHASADEILARENELPTYQPKAEEGDEVQQGNTSSSSSSHVVVLCEALPPQYDDVVIEMPDQTPAATLPAAAESLNRP
ncbi:hypothetical protein BG004_007774 [Podila humilis]|nr:hypothetical protein BG004_007774 [Podila humilis]